MRTIYFDYAAATPLDKRVFVAMEPYLRDSFYNPSSAYQPAREIRAKLTDAKHQLAMVIGARPSEIVITAGATESINLAISGCLTTYGGSIVTTSIEHPAVIETAKQFAATFVAPTDKGMIRADAIFDAITDETTLVSVGYVNSELGTIQPLKEIARCIETVRDDRRQRGVERPLYFHTDASQAAGYLDLSVARLGVDMMTLNAGKCYGPKQVGLLYAQSLIRLAPIIHGGGQEHGVRSGTENVAGIIGFATALTRVDKHRKSEGVRLGKLRDQMETSLLSAFPDLQINGYSKKRLPNHLHISLADLDGERALFALDTKGVLVATGSACAANKGTRSHVLEAIGLETALADGSLRITLGHPTTEQDCIEATQLIIDVLLNERGK